MVHAPVQSERGGLGLEERALVAQRAWFRVAEGKRCEDDDDDDSTKSGQNSMVHAPRAN